MRSADRVCVVVATRNRRAELAHTLARHEAPVIVVDNASTDGTAGFVREAFPDVKVVELAENLGGAARNIGVARAEAPYVAFADDDSWWEPGALASAVRILDRYPRTALIAAQVVIAPDNRVDGISTLMARSPLGRSAEQPGPRILGFLACGVVVRKKAFEAVGGFSPLLHTYGEESLLAIDLAAAGWELAYVEELRAWHQPSARRAAPDGRRRREARNRLLTVWLRRPVSTAVAETVRATRTPAGRRGLVDAVRVLPEVVRQRRPVPEHLERRLRLLDRMEPT